MRPAACLRWAVCLLLAAQALGTVAAAAVPAVIESSASAASPTSLHHPGAWTKKKPPAVAVKLVDINSAPKSELMKLPGIGEPEAIKIVAGRPYYSKAELVTRQVMPHGPYLLIKDKVVAMQKSPPKRRP